MNTDDYLKLAARLDDPATTAADAEAICERLYRAGSLLIDDPATAPAAKLSVLADFADRQWVADLPATLRRIAATI